MCLQGPGMADCELLFECEVSSLFSKVDVVFWKCQNSYSRGSAHRKSSVYHQVIFSVFVKVCADDVKFLLLTDRPLLSLRLLVVSWIWKTELKLIRATEKGSGFGYVYKNYPGRYPLAVKELCLMFSNWILCCELVISACKAMSRSIIILRSKDASHRI